MTLAHPLFGLLLALDIGLLAAQPRTVAERLGYPADAKLLIIHGDDLGVAHAVNTASLDALERGAISSASVMMPTPWVAEVAAWARAHPDADLGLHLTLTSEWDGYRWGGVESANRIPSLLDSAGVFPPDVPSVARRASPAEVERELRAQVERALALGIRPTHLDTHMGTLFATPELAERYAKVAREYRLPFLVFRSGGIGSQPPLEADEIALDAVVMAGSGVPRDRWKGFYLDAIANLKPGLTEMIVHLGRDDAELRAVTVNHEPFGAAWRQRDYEVVTDPDSRRALAEHRVIVVTWRELARARR